MDEKDFFEDWDESEYFEDEYEEGYEETESEDEYTDEEYADDAYGDEEYADDAYGDEEYPDEDYSDVQYEKSYDDGLYAAFAGAEGIPQSASERTPRPERVHLTAEERAERKRRRNRQVRMMKALIVAGIVLVIAAIGGIIFAVKKHMDQKAGNAAQTVAEASADGSVQESNLVTDNLALEDGEAGVMTQPLISENSLSEDSVSQDAASENEEGTPGAGDPAEYYAIGGLSDAQAMNSPEFTSEYGIIANTTKRQVVAQKGAKERMIPASMTKVLTLLVAAEHVTDLDDTFTITLEVTDYAYSNDCSAAGFGRDEVVTVRDLLYGTILPSGGDAAYALACYVAGSHEAFVDMMNEKLEELGLAETTHFMNCVGIFEDNHYSTPYDMAVIMEAAMDNELCREVLTTRVFKTSKTEQHPDGITLSNKFNRRIEDYELGGEELGAKTGFVNESLNCAVSSYRCTDGDEYVCVTAGAKGAWRCIYDHVAAYQIYAAGNTGYTKEHDLKKVEGAL